MKIIVTGATGFLGTALCKELLQNGHQVTAIVREGSNKKEKLDFSKELSKEQQENLEILELSLEQMEQLPEMLDSTQDIFYHLAWNGSSGAARNDFEQQQSNITYTAQAIKAAKKCGCSKFIGAGSQAEYGVVKGIAKEYETPAHPFMMYGAAKNAAYQMGKIVAAQEEISFVWPRIYSVYGVGENAGTLVNYVIECLQNGTTAELSPCTNDWDFLYITDCVKALRILGEQKESEGIYHVASGKTEKLCTFVEKIRTIVNKEGNLNFCARTMDENRTFWLRADVSRMKELGFEAEVGFEDGIRRKQEESDKWTN